MIHGPFLPKNARNASHSSTFRTTKVFKIMTICHAQNLRKLVRSGNSSVYYAPKICEIYQVLSYSVDFKALGELWIPLSKTVLNTLRPRQNGRHFPDDIFKWIFVNENVWISIKISLKFVPRGPVNNIPTLVQVMAWRRPGDKPFSEPMMVRLPTHICVTRPQWVNKYSFVKNKGHVNIWNGCKAEK